MSIRSEEHTSATQQNYVNEANDYYEDTALQLGVDETLLVTPIPMVCKRMLLNYVTMRVAEDSIGTNSVTLAAGEDMYVELRATSQETVKNLQAQITPELLTGQSETNRIGRSVSFGKIWRSQ